MESIVFPAGAAVAATGLLIAALVVRKDAEWGGGRGGLLVPDLLLLSVVFAFLIEQARARSYCEGTLTLLGLGLFIWAVAASLAAAGTAWYRWRKLTDGRPENPEKA